MSGVESASVLALGLVESRCSLCPGWKGSAMMTVTFMTCFPYVFIVMYLHLSLCRFCQSCLQECLRPQKPVCAVCRATLGHWAKAVELEAVIQSSVAACKGCGAQVWVMKVQKLA